MDTLVNDLDALVAGTVVRPGTNEYEKSIMLYNGAATARPRAIVQVDGPADVAAGISAAKRAGLPLSIRSGGHSVASFGLCDGIVLDLRRLRSTDVDPAARRIRTGAGVTWLDYDFATQQHGLASAGGVVSSTGVAGLTLGGGIGTLRGVTGLACDSLHALEVVLADGSIVRASADSEPDLFWALHGGGGAFGVVTTLELDLVPLTRIVHGQLSYPLDQAQAVAANYRTFVPEMPDEFVCDFMVMKMPGQDWSFNMMVRFVGDDPAAEETMRALRAFGKPFDMVSEQTYCEAQHWMDRGAPWGRRHFWKTQTLRDLDEEVVEAAVEVIRAAPSEHAKLMIEHLHGEVSRIPRDATPIGFRHAPFNFSVVGEWDGDENDAANREWVQASAERMAPFGVGGAYTNYMPAGSTVEEVEQAYGADNYRRLREIKARYDAENVFSGCQPIPPAERG